MGLINRFTNGCNTPSASATRKHRQQRRASLPAKLMDETMDDHADNGDIKANSEMAVNHSAIALHKRWIPKKKSVLFASSNRTNSISSVNYSSKRLSPSSLAEFTDGDISLVDDHDMSNLLKEIKDENEFKEAVKQNRGGGGGGSVSSEPELPETSDPAHQANVERHLPKRRSSVVSSEGSFSEELSDNDNTELDHLDIQANTPRLDSKSMLAELGDFPSASELANVAAVRATEYINECLFNDDVNRESGAAAATSVLDRQRWELIPQYSKSDLTVGKYLGKGSFSDVFEVSVMVAANQKKLDLSDKEDLDRRIEAKFAKTTLNKNDLGEEEEREAGGEHDLQIEAMFAAAPLAPKKPNQGSFRARRQTTDSGVAASFCFGGAQASSRPVQKKQATYAMKCLRPRMRSAEEFIFGVEDLVHETAMLASLDHPNIIQLRGRAICNSFRLSDGYFILLDQLQSTLEDRIEDWRRVAATAGKGKNSKAAPTVSKLKAACSIADALSYLHSKNVVFRDLKPANIGFNSSGVLKLFDFGFAVGVKSEFELLYDGCGTPRYMAPEIGFGRGYSFPADVHSFGILLWEILSLKKPFGKIESQDEFHRMVLVKGVRPKLARSWPRCLKDVMSGCWCVESRERPVMEVVARILGAYAREFSSKLQNNNAGSFRKSSVFRRLTG